MAKAVFLDFEKDLGDIAAKIENSQNKPEAIITPPAAANYSSVPSSQAS